MNPEYRQKLLALQSHLEQLIAEAEDVLVGPTDDDIMLRASKTLKEFREALAEVKAKLDRLALSTSMALPATKARLRLGFASADVAMCLCVRALTWCGLIERVPAAAATKRALSPNTSEWLGSQ